MWRFGGMERKYSLEYVNTILDKLERVTGDGAIVHDALILRITLTNFLNLMKKSKFREVHEKSFIRSIEKSEKFLVDLVN